MCSLAASAATRAATFFSPRSLQRRGDVVGDRHRRVVDELLVDHRDVALAHRLAGHVLAVGEDAALGRRVEPGHHAHQRRLAGLRRAEQHGDRARHERQVERVQPGRGADPLLDALERQLHARSDARPASRRRRPVAPRTSARRRRAPPRSGAGRAWCAARARRRRCAPTRGRAGSAARPRAARARPRRRGRRRRAALDARAVGARQPAARSARRQPGMAQRERLHEAHEVGVGPAAARRSAAQVAAGQRRVARPGAAQRRQRRARAGRRPPRRACGRS